MPGPKLVKAAIVAAGESDGTAQKKNDQALKSKIPGEKSFLELLISPPLVTEKLKKQR
jgi:hypothetical protein